jgi:hypothetical protein
MEAASCSTEPPKRAMSRDQVLDGFLAPVEHDQRGSGATLGLGTIDWRIHSGKQNQCSSEVACRLLCRTVQKRCLPKSMRQR